MKLQELLKESYGIGGHLGRVQSTQEYGPYYKERVLNEVTFRFNLAMDALKRDHYQNTGHEDFDLHYFSCMACQTLRVIDDPEKE
ncbi:MAG: hypothetical protein V3W37_02400 [Candidatus Binatia bacterium]